MQFVERRAYWVNFVPFGAGQFQNDQRGKGIAFAVGQGAAAATSIGVFWYLVDRYGYGGTVPANESGDVRRFQQIGTGASIAFAGLAVWGIVDALWCYEPTVVRDVPLPRVGPAVVGDGPGVVVRWTR